MALDVEVPEPPDLSNRGMPGEFEWQDETLGSEDFYRENLEDLLQEGAWTEGFNEWTEYTDLDEGQVRIVSDLFTLFLDLVVLRGIFERSGIDHTERVYSRVIASRQVCGVPDGCLCTVTSVGRDEDVIEHQ